MFNAIFVFLTCFPLIKSNQNIDSSFVYGYYFTVSYRNKNKNEKAYNPYVVNIFLPDTTSPKKREISLNRLLKRVANCDTIFIFSDHYLIAEFNKITNSKYNTLEYDNAYYPTRRKYSKKGIRYIYKWTRVRVSAVKSTVPRNMALEFLDITGCASKQEIIPMFLIREMEIF